MVILYQSPLDSNSPFFVTYVDVINLKNYYSFTPKQQRTLWFYSYSITSP